MDKINKAVEELKKDLKSNYEGAIGIILGTSFSDFVDEIKVEKEVPLKKLDCLNLIASDKEENKLIFGEVEGKKVILMFGRIHYNLGYNPVDIANIIFLLKRLGADKLILTASVGAISKKLKVGDIVTFNDQINFTGRNPLYAYQGNEYGDTFIDMITPYDPQLINTLVTTAKSEMAIKVRNGVVVEFAGPSAETVSESRLSQLLGADVVGFNICNEVIACKYCNLPVVGYALVTNYASAFTNNRIKHEDIVYNRKCASNYYLELLTRFIKNIE